MKTLTVNVYVFDELDDQAKEKAREWYRRGAADDGFWAECVIDDSKAIGARMGITIDQIGFSGFWSQGDGAHFTGSWARTVEAEKAVQEHAPLDQKLHRIARELGGMPEAATATVKHAGHYQHDGCTNIEVFDCDQEDVVRELLRDFMRWIYTQLEAAHDFANSDESVDENIRANEYEFTIKGTRYV